jgi:hypothetical protein
VFDARQVVVCVTWRTRKENSLRTSIPSGNFSVFSEAVNKEN